MAIDQVQTKTRKEYMNSYFFHEECCTIKGKMTLPPLYLIAPTTNQHHHENHWIGCLSWLLRHNIHVLHHGHKKWGNSADETAAPVTSTFKVLLLVAASGWTALPFKRQPRARQPGGSQVVAASQDMARQPQGVGQQQPVAARGPPG